METPQKLSFKHYALKLIKQIYGRRKNPAADDGCLSAGGDFPCGQGITTAGEGLLLRWVFSMQDLLWWYLSCGR
jgi:hypothetical protein